ncbi:MAG: hypothetical protein SF051_11510 [Elusimicrobiota bacterium]|nr:hypothetical protein [Elusimicrobiota bacterium]
MRFFASVLTALTLCACGGEGTGAAKTLPDVRLKTLGGATGPSLATCPTDKCLTVLVAPWCGVCHQVSGDVIRLRRYLDEKGVASRVVVGLATLEEIAPFAARFGPDALLDPDGAFRARGVPLFVTTDRDGKVLKTVPGFPRGSATLGELAASFGLP